MELAGGRLRSSARSSGRKRHVLPAARLAVEQGPGRDGHVQHFLQAQGLGAELDVVGFGAPWAGPACTRPGGGGSPGGSRWTNSTTRRCRKAQAEDRRGSPRGPDARPGSGPAGMGLLVQMAALDRERFSAQSRSTWISAHCRGRTAGAAERRTGRSSSSAYDRHRPMASSWVIPTRSSVNDRPRKVLVVNAAARQSAKDRGGRPSVTSPFVSPGSGWTPALGLHRRGRRADRPGRCPAGSRAGRRCRRPAACWPGRRTCPARTSGRAHS